MKISGNIDDLVMRTIATRRATNPKDIVFDLHSVLERFSNPGIPLPNIDYSLSLHKVYRKFTVYPVRKGSTLRVLGFAGKFLNPSWVPDYSQEFGSSPLLGLLPNELSVGEKRPSVYETRRTDFNTDRQSYGRFGVADNTFFTHGHKVCEITDVCHRFRHTQPAYQSSDTHLHRENLKLMRHWYQMHEYVINQSELYYLLLGAFSDEASGTGAPIS
jgi:hypothetical protein